VKMKYVQFFLASFVCLSLVSPCFASVDEQVKFRIVSDKTDLLVGGTAIIKVQAWVDSALGTAGNGIDTWQMDISVNNISGVVGITDTAGIADISLIAPNPDSLWSGWSSVNGPDTGEILEIAVSQEDFGASSETGIGVYSDLFSFKIEALAEGIVTYTPMDNGGGLFYAALVDGTEFEGSDSGGVYFDEAGSSNVINVTPEPCSLLIMSGLSILGLRRRCRR
jgi:hypothetical protein